MKKVVMRASLIVLAALPAAVPPRVEAQSIEHLRERVREVAESWEHELGSAEYSYQLQYALVALGYDAPVARRWSPSALVVFGVDWYFWVAVQVNVLDHGVQVIAELIEPGADERYLRSSLGSDPFFRVSAVLYRESLEQVGELISGREASALVLKGLQEMQGLLRETPEVPEGATAPRLKYWMDVAVGDTRVQRLWWDDCAPAAGGYADFILGLAGFHRDALLRRFERPLPDCSDP